MKKIFGSILHVISLLAILASLVNLFISYNAYQSNHCTENCLFVVRNFERPLLYGVSFILISILTYYFGKYLKK